MKSLYPSRNDLQRNLKECSSTLTALQTQLKEGADQAQRGEYTKVTAPKFLNEMKSGVDDA